MQVHVAVQRLDREPDEGQGVLHRLDAAARNRSGGRGTPDQLGGNEHVDLVHRPGIEQAAQ